MLNTLQAINNLQDKPHPVHAMGYCLVAPSLPISGTAVVLAGRATCVMGCPTVAAEDVHPCWLRRPTLRNPGELGLFIDESQIG